MTSPFIGQIIQGGWNFAPRGYSMCNGQQLSIAQNTALFSLLGTQFGGNGQTTFGLPNLQGRMMMHWGNGAGLSSRQIGETAGNENATLTINNMPAHNHAFTNTSSLNATTLKAQVAAPSAGAMLARSADDIGTAVPEIYAPAGSTPTVALGGLNVAGTVGITGGSQPFGTISPFQCVTHVIALQGIFPSRN